MFPRVLGYKRGSEIIEVRVYLIGLWFGEDQRTNTIKTHALKRLDYVFRFH